MAASACLISSSVFFLVLEHLSISGECRFEDWSFVAGFLTTFKWTALNVSFRHRGQCATLACSGTTVEQDGLSAKRQQTPSLHRVPGGHSQVVLRCTNLAGIYTQDYHLDEVLTSIQGALKERWFDVCADRNRARPRTLSAIGSRNQSPARRTRAASTNSKEQISRAANYLRPTLDLGFSTANR